MKSHALRARFALATALLGFNWASPALSQTGDGYVGIYRDSLGTMPCATVPQYSGTTLYVIAKTSGTSSNGITGAEFRIEVTSPAGWLLSYTPPGSANIVYGDPLDVSSDSTDTSGLNISFPHCVQPTNGCIALGTIAVFNISGTPTELLVKQHNRPSNPGYPCPLFVTCDESYTKWCMSTSTEQPCSVGKVGLQRRSNDGAVFAAILNTNDPVHAIDLRTPNEQILALFTPGVVTLPAEQNVATIQETTVNSDSLSTLFQSYGVSAVARAFPAGAPFPEFQDVLRLVLSNTAARDSLVQVLEHESDVVFAEKNGGAIGGSQIESAELSGGHNGPTLKASPERLSTTCTFGPPLYACSYTADVCTDDPLVGYQWPIFNVGASGLGGTCNEDMNVDEAWSTTTGAGATIQLMGSGVWRDHPDLQGRIVGDASSETRDTQSVGVIVANANNNFGVAGLNWNARVKLNHIANANGTVTDDVGLVSALGTAGASQDRIILNLFRLADANGDHRWSPLVRATMRNLYRNNNKILVAPMGNTWNPEGTEFPAGFKLGVVTVGATERYGGLSYSSKTGVHVDIAAPGDAVMTTGPYSDSEFGYATGTELAAAEVAGAAGLLLAQRSDLLNDDVSELLQQTAVAKGLPGFDDNYGWGRVDLGYAMRLLQSPYRYRHLTAAGMTHQYSRGTVDMMFRVPPREGWLARRYSTCERLEIDKEVPIPSEFGSNPWMKVWGCPSKTTGYEHDPEADGDWYALGWCEVADIQPDKVVLKTWVYRWFNPADFSDTWGWFPCAPEEVHWEYSFIGRLQTTSMSGDSAADTQLSLHVQSPMKNVSTVVFTLPKPTNIRLEIFNVAGARVATLQSGRLAAGRHEVTWQGVGSDGTRLRSGVYMAKLEGEGRSLSRKIVLVR